MPQEVYEPKYVISIAARILGCEIHTLRYYEKLGVVKPYRSGGNIRYYSEADIDQLRHIKALMEDMGVNMAGVEVILKLREKMVEMQHRIDLLDTELRKYKKIEIERKNIKSGG
jgi:MerR family transcriptional regulator, heat shock protein HspR